MAEITIESRLSNIETCYTRFTDGLHRIGNAVERQEKEVARAMDIIVGHLDTETNIYVNGMLQTLKGVNEKQEHCLKRQARNWSRVWMVSSGVGVIVVAALILTHFGIGG